MGTRGFIGFVIDGNEKIAYNHWDSYPGGLGVDVLEWLRKEHAGHIRRKAAELRVVDPNSKPTAEDVERLRGYTNTNVGTQQLDDWYVLLRETQGNPAAMLDAGVIEDGSGFPLDSLFAEYGYLVDLDENRFEAYRGFQNAEHEKGRFAGRSGARDGYYPCALVASWPLDELPSNDNFEAAFGTDEDED
jgi:hypothetical protein